MIKLKVDQRNRKVFAKIGRIPKDMRQGIRRGWFDYGKTLKSEANREILHGLKTGHTYNIRTSGGRRRRHVASAPGETHANLSGDLRKAIRWSVRGFDTAELAYGSDFSSANPAPEYDVFVEFGKPSDPTGTARPSLLNAINATQGDAKRTLQHALDRALQ